MLCQAPNLAPMTANSLLLVQRFMPLLAVVPIREQEDERTGTDDISNHNESRGDPTAKLGHAYSWFICICTADVIYTEVPWSLGESPSAAACEGEDRLVLEHGSGK